MIDATAADIRLAMRQARRTPGLALAVIATLALTIGAGTTLFSVLNAVAFRTVPVRDPSRLVALSLTDKGGQAVRLINYTTYTEFVSQQRVFDKTFLYSGGGAFELEARGAQMDGGIAAVTPEFFDVLGLKPFLGRLIGPDDAPASGGPASVAVLGYEQWQRLFHGDRTAVGERLLISGFPVTIVGVLPEGFSGLHVDAGDDFYVPLTLLRQINDTPTNPVRAYNIIGRLKSGITLEQARAEIVAMWPALQADTLPSGLSPAERSDVQAQRVRVESAASGFSTLRQRYATPLTLLAGLAAVLLLISFGNLSGLQYAQALAREQQLAIALALGATRVRLVRVLLIESLFLSLAGTLLAIPLVWALSRLIGTMLWTSAYPLVMSLTPDARVFGVMGIVSILAGLAIGALPASLASRADPKQALLRGRAMVASSRRWAKAVLVTQVALSLVLLFTAGLFAASLAKLRALDSGFTTDGVLFTRAWALPGPRRAYDEQTYYPALVERLSALPGVRSVALSHFFPGYLNFTALPTAAIARAEMPDRSAEVQGLFEYISPRFFETAGATIVRGRDLRWTDRADSPQVVIINEALERQLFPNRDAVGARVRLGADARTQSVEIVGVATDMTIANLRSPHVPVAFRPRLQEPRFMRIPIVTVRVQGDVPSVASALGPAIRSLGQEYIRGVETLDWQIDATLQQERLLAGASILFGGLAASLVLVGLYALQAHAVTRRTREIGLRMAIGASHRHVIGLVIREVAGPTVLGVVIGVPCALVAGRLARALLFGAASADVRLLAGAALMFGLLTGAAAWIPARRASRVDPLVALRAD